jgi:hypothetical protein
MTIDYLNNEKLRAVILPILKFYRMQDNPPTS